MPKWFSNVVSLAIKSLSPEAFQYLSSVELIAECLSLVFCTKRNSFDEKQMHLKRLANFIN
ncbi:hypothetical protein C0J52_01594 [Blattella germanica]|nr:hypothetical protein C0J52_01594 [Blattella germanica]